MKKVILLVWCLTFLAAIPVTANDKIDSLLSVLNRQKVDTNRVRTLSSLAREYQLTGQFDQGIPYLLEGIQLGEKLHFNSELGALYRRRGDYHKASKEFKEALQAYTKSIQIEKDRGRMDMVAFGHNKMAKIHLANEAFAKAIVEHQNELSVYESLHDTSSIVDALFALWDIHYHKIDAFQTAGEYLDRIRLVVDASKNDTLVGALYTRMGTFYTDEGDMGLAFEYLYKAARIHERLQMMVMLSSNYNSISSVYQKAGNYKKGLEYSLHALEVDEKLGNVEQLGFANNNVAWAYILNEQYSEALDYGLRSAEYYLKIGDQSGVAYPYGNLGLIYYHLEKYDKAIEYSSRAMAIFEKEEDPTGVSEALNNIGKVYLKKGDYKKALDHLARGLELAKQGDYWIEVRNSYDGLAKAYAALGDHKNAYQNQLLFMQWNDSVLNKENSDRINNLNFSLTNEIHQKQVELLNKDALLREADLQKQRTIIWSIGGGAILLLLLVFYVYRGFREKKRSNERLAQFNQEVLQQKSEIEKQHVIISEKNKHITDSINYAKKIQDAILPAESSFRRHLEEFFVLYRPKDIVSGDFYWMEEKNGKILFAVVDCTGHGVPGAFVSIVGNNGLNRAVNEFGLTKPSDILDKLNDLVEESFSKQTRNSQIQDGMDIALCAYDKNTGVLEFSGANNPIYIIRDGQLKEIKGDKQPIGAFENRKRFTNHLIQLSGSESVYIFSDGYADQFGGPSRKKLKYNNFKNILIGQYNKTMAEQRKFLEKTIRDWMGDLEQVDDICIIGINFKTS